MLVPLGGVLSSSWWELVRCFFGRQADGGVVWLNVGIMCMAWFKCWRGRGVVVEPVNKPAGVWVSAGRMESACEAMKRGEGRGERPRGA